MMAVPAEAGATQMNRQDFAGFSFLGRGSNYQLAGPPGWTSDPPSESTLTPHPDWYSTVLWKQLMGSTILGNVTINGISSIAAAGISNASVQIWCANTQTGTLAGSRGGITLVVVNAASSAQAFAVPSIAAGTPREEYVLTATANMYTGAGDSADNLRGSIPTVLWTDEIYLNGVRMTVRGDGMLPEYPIPGKAVQGGDPASAVRFPAWSYGFVVFPDANVAACKLS